MPLTRRVLLFLTIPLIAFAIISLVINGLLAGRFDVSGFFMDLGTNAIGILISIFFIDVILAILAQEEWASAERLVRKSIAYLAVTSLQCLDKSLGGLATNAVLKERLRDKLNAKSAIGRLPKLSAEYRPPEIIAFYESYSREDVKRQLCELSEEQGNSLVAALDTCVREARQVIDLYMSKLPVSFVQCLLEIQECIFDFRKYIEVGEMEKFEEWILKNPKIPEPATPALPSPASAAGTASERHMDVQPKRIAGYSRQTQSELIRLLHQIICKYLALYSVSAGRKKVRRSVLAAFRQE